VHQICAKTALREDLKKIVRKVGVVFALFTISISKQEKQTRQGGNKVNLYLRLVLVLLASTRRSRLQYDAPCITRFRVWPHDLDVFGHMNNGRYLQIMDVSRTEWMARTGVLSAMLSQKWSAVLGGGLTRYRRSLKLMQSYEVHTQLTHWDKRWFYFEHTFIDPQSKKVAVGVSRAALRSRSKWVNTATIVNQVSPDAICPPAPDYISQWQDIDDAIFKQAGNSRDEETAELIEVTS
jgi:YbgC/YbaW family acyl-CoA thioester hydrolase